MQRVLHEYRNKSRIFNMIEALYAYISDRDKFNDEDVLWLDTSFEGLSGILMQYLLMYRIPKFKSLDLPIVSHNFRSNEVTVCLSGGKDSAACAYLLKSQGYIVHLYHVTGVNKAYGDEKSAAKRIADYLGCDLFIDRIELNGSHNYTEHPLKNYIIANGAIHYCLANGYSPVIATGNFNQAVLNDNPFDVCGGDCIDMWNEYRTIIRKVIPDFDVLIPLRTNSDTFEILQNDWKLFELSVSCMSPYRFRAFWKHRCEEQYNIRLFENRCGVCWKCCIEEIWLMDTDKMPYLESYYTHCFGILASTVFKETGRQDAYDMIWNNYMWYPIEKSKAYKLLPMIKIKYLNNLSVQILLGGERIDAPIQARKAKSAR